MRMTIAVLGLALPLVVLGVLFFGLKRTLDTFDWRDYDD
jgi:hypothetical protein